MEISLSNKWEKKISSLGLTALFLLLPLAAFSGWYVAKEQYRRQVNPAVPNSKIPPKYFLGLNYLLNEQPEKAVEVFLQLVDVNEEFIETHFTLGNLFRKKGEVDKAIRLHQSLLDKPTLSSDFKALAKLELAKDYVKAGVLDRAENLFSQLQAQNLHIESSLKNLVDIYQQAKDWHRAIQAAEQLQIVTKRSQAPKIAHYYCELAESELIVGDLKLAQQYLDLAESINKNCARASILRGNIQANAGNFRAALENYQNVFKKNIRYFYEIASSINRCYLALKNKDEIEQFFKSCLGQQPDTAVALAFSDWLKLTVGAKAAANFLSEYLPNNPSLRGLADLIAVSDNTFLGINKSNLQILKLLVDKLINRKPNYRCDNCGFTGRILQWLCPGCKEWETFKPIYDLDEE